MAKPKEAVPNTVQETKPPAPKVKIVQLYAGVDLLGSKTSLDFKKADLQIMSWGILAVSKNNQRTVGIPWANVKGFELMPE